MGIFFVARHNVMFHAQDALDIKRLLRLRRIHGGEEYIFKTLVLKC